MSENNNFKAENVNENEIYRFIVMQWMHQNQLSWSRLNVMLALETAILAGAFAIKGCIGILLLIVGTLVGFIIYQLMRRDWHIRDQNLTLLDQVHEPIGIKMIIPAKEKIENGQFLLKALFTIFIGTNIISLVILLAAGLN